MGIPRDSGVLISIMKELPAGGLTSGLDAGQERVEGGSAECQRCGVAVLGVADSRPREAARPVA